MQHHLDGVATLLIDNRYLDVAQQAEQHKHGGEIEVVAAYALGNLWRHGVHDVTDERHAGRYGDGLVYERQVVTTGVVSRCLTRGVHAQHIVTTFGEREEEGEQEGHEHNPLAQLHIGSLTAGDDAQHEAESHDAHVEDGILLKLGAVGEVKNIIEQQHRHHVPHCLRLKQQRCSHAQHKHQSHEPVGMAHRHRTRSHGALTFERMMAVVIGIDDVVITIDRRGNETESKEHHQSTKDGCHVKQFATKEQGYENEEVLYPVLRTYKS